MCQFDFPPDSSGLHRDCGYHRFRLGQIGTGLLYLFTLGFVFVGTLYDLLTYEKSVFEHNKFAALRAEMNVRGE